MTDKQFNKILLMFSMILDGCDDLEEAKEKVKELLEENEDRKDTYKNTPRNAGCSYFVMCLYEDHLISVIVYLPSFGVREILYCLALSIPFSCMAAMVS